MVYKSLDYRTWHELKSTVVYEICKKDIFPYSKYIFRGQTDADWNLVSSFDRNYGSLPYDERKRIETQLLDEFKKTCIEWEGKENFNYYNIQQILSAGQHYGLPTRLLDWSYSIYIASFFAFSQKSSSPYAAIWVINTEHEIWKGEYGVSIEKSHILENERQKYQYGIFTRNQTINNTLEEYVEECSKRCNVDGALYKITLPTSERGSVLHDLEMMGINYYSLFRGLEGCAKEAVLKVFP